MLKFLYLVLSYLLGSILFSLLLPKIIYNVNITEKSSDHNPGSSNVFSNCGIIMGIICLSLDIIKGFIPVFLFRIIFNENSIWLLLVIIAPVFGHIFPIFNNFKGGKGIATSFGVLLGLIPYSFIVFVLAFFYLFFSLVIKIYPIRKRSIVTYLCFGVSGLLISLYYNHFYIGIAAIIIGLLCALKHTKYLSIVNDEKE